MEKRTCFRLVSFILALVLTFCSLPMLAFARQRDEEDEPTPLLGNSLQMEANENASLVQSAENARREVRLLGELAELRESNAKHFLYSDGTVRCAVYEQDVHYLDENGLWQDIDNTLTFLEDENGTSTYGLEQNRNMDVSQNAPIVRFAPTAGGEGYLYKMYLGAYSAFFAPLGAAFSQAQVMQEQEQESDNPTVLTKLSSSVLYEDVWEETDLAYYLRGASVFEHIIVKSAKESYSYGFRMQLSGLTPSLTSDGSIVLSDSESQEAIYVIPPSYMYDSEGASSNSVTYTLTEQGSGVWHLTITADKAWMDAQDRVFPVIIDPPVTISGSSKTVDTYIDSQNPTESYADQPYAYAGKIGQYSTEMFWRAKSISSIPSDSVVIDATLTFWGCIPGRAGNVALGAYPVLHSWSTSLCYNNVYGANATVLVDTEPVDFVALSNTSDYELNKPFSFNVTEVMRKWYSNGSNYGLCIKLLDGVEPISNNRPQYVSIYTSTSNIAGVAPVLSVTYKSIVGLENYFSYTTVGTAGGTGYINHTTGQMVHTFASVPSAEAIFSYAPQIYYVQGQGMNGGIGHADKGAGFFFDWDRSISKIKLVGGVQVFCYTDADRTEHYFTATDTPNLYKDEDGLQLELETVYTNGTLSAYHLTDGFTTYKFDDTGKFVEIEDENGNRLCFVREWGNVKQIVLYPSGQTQGIVQLEMTYEQTEAVLTKIHCPQTGDALAFEYTSKYDEIDTHFVIYTSLTYKKGNTAVTSLSLDYDTSANLLSITDDVALYRTEFDYAPSGYKHIVVSLTEYARESADATYTEGQKISFAYEQWLTTVRSSGSDDVYGIGADGTSDDLCTCYALDMAGRAIFAYTCDIDGTQIYGSSGAVYEATANTPTNGLSQTFTTGVFTQNLLENGNFENTSGWALMGNITYDNNGTVFDGGKALRFALDGTSEETQQAYQRVYLSAGTYTLSGLFFVEKGDVKGITTWLSICTTQGLLPGSEIKSSIPIEMHNIEIATRNPVPLSVTFTISEAEAGTYAVCLMAKADADEGQEPAFVYADGIVLAESEEMSLYNYLQNGDFRDGNIHWYNLDMTEEIDGAATVENGMLAIDGGWDVFASVEQTVTFAGNTAGAQTYALSGWMKATSAFPATKSTLALHARVIYTDETWDGFFFSFNHSYEDWQYISGMFSTDASKTVASIKVWCINHLNEGTVYFDDLSLVRSNANMTTYYEYDASGRLVSTRDGDGKSNTYTYIGESGKLVSEAVTVNGEKISYDYDTIVSTRLEQATIDLDGDNTEELVTEYAYNDYGQITGTKVTALGTNGLKTSSGATYSENVNSFGFTLSETDQNNATTTYEYTNGMLQKVIFSDGQTGLWYEYDAKGNLISVLPIAGGVVQENSASVSYTYDSCGRLAALSTESTTCTFTYDAFGRNTSISVGGRVMASYTYRSGNGKLLSVTYGNGYVCSYEYDHLGRVSKVTFAYNGTNGSDNVEYEYHYNTEGRLVTLVDYGADCRTVYEYDASGRILRETVFGVTQENAQTFEQYLISSRYFCYNEKGKTVETGIFLVADERYYPLNQGEAQDRFYRTVFHYGYETTAEDGTESVTDGNLVTSIDVYIDGAQTPTYTRTFTYDDLERQTSSSLTSGALTIATTPWYQNYYVMENGSRVTYATTLASGYMHNVSYAGQSKHKEYAEYYYDANYRISSIVYHSYDEDGYLNSPIFDIFVYDDLGQLVRENNARLNRTYVYTYDNAGNLTQKKEYAYTTGSTENATPLDVINYTYGDSAWGDLLTSFDEQSITYDAIGNPLEYRGMEFEWSDGRRLSKVNENITYAYNADGLRVEKTDGDTTYRYLYDGGNLIRIEKESGTYLEYVDFLYDEATLFGFRFCDPYTSGYGTYYYLYGHGGNVEGILDGSGNVLVRYIYDAWGNFTEELTFEGQQNPFNVQAIFMNPFRYRGYVYDFETGLYYLQSRYYDPETGRFISADDQMAGVGGDLLGYNLFAYCQNDPVNQVDPTGHMPRWLEKVVTVAAAVVAVVIAPIVIVLNIVAIVKSNNYVEETGDLSSVLETEHYNEEVKNGVGNLTKEEQLAYVRNLKNNDNDGDYTDWTEAEMLREVSYHAKGYQVLKFFGLGETRFAKRLTHVDFEKKQNWETYVRRIYGNMMFWEVQE